MNFQAVSVGQKLVVKSISIIGGYTDALRNVQRGSAEGNIPMGFLRRTPPGKTSRGQQTSIMWGYDSGDGMTSRRRFLQMSSAAAGTIIGGVPALAESGRMCPPLPAPIARLKSMKDQAKPITGEERIARQEQARRLMKVNHLSAMLLADGTSLEYFTGIRWWGSERLFAMVLPSSRPAFYVCPAFEEGRARERIAKFADAEQADIRVWQEDENPYQR